MKKTKIKKDLFNRIKEIGSENKVRGITLISLVITIVVLLILTSVTINMMIGNNGLLNNVKTAKEEYINAQKAEINSINSIQDVIGQYIESGRVTNSEVISKNIDDYTTEIKEVNGTYITAKIPDNISNNPKVIGYIYLLDGKVVDLTKENEYSFKNLEMETTHSISSIAVEDNGCVKIANSISMTTSDKLYLYDEGKEFTFITGGWKKTGYDGSDSGTITKNSDFIYVYAPNGSRVFCGTTNKIDLSNYTKLFIQNTSSTQCLFQISGTSYYNRSPGSDLSYGNDYYNISGYNGEYYIHFTNANGGYQNIKKVWLEK